MLLSSHSDERFNVIINLGYKILHEIYLEIEIHSQFLWGDPRSHIDRWLETVSPEWERERTFAVLLKKIMMKSLPRHNCGWAFPAWKDLTFKHNYRGFSFTEARFKNIRASFKHFTPFWKRILWTSLFDFYDERQLRSIKK